MTDGTVPTVKRKNLLFVGILKVTEEKSWIRSRIRFYNPVVRIRPFSNGSAGGGGHTIPTRGHTVQCGTLGIYVLCGYMVTA
jgi:hypothetical protein